MAKIQVSPISGFPELLPNEQILFNRLKGIIQRGFELHGFAPIETPAVERVEVLTSKGGDTSDQEIFGLTRLAARASEAETDLALHFDLTVPLARYVALHQYELHFPFRRYQIQKVWRAEKAQAGRFREFYQCDIDVIGRGSLDIIADAEIPGVIYQIFREMEIGDFVIRVSNRKILTGYFASLGITDATAALRITDKLEKIGKEAVVQELEGLGIASETALRVIDFIVQGAQRDTDAMLAWLQTLAAETENETFREGVTELGVVVAGIRGFGVPDAYFAIDVGVVRGLDYYTGTIYETLLVDHPEIGSICSGGRYDDLASFFTDEKLPGVGISIGLSRLVSQLLEAHILQAETSTSAPVLVTILHRERMTDYLGFAAELRNLGIPCEVYLEADKLGKQLTYANKKGFPVCLVIGESEFASGTVTIKNMVTGEQQTHPKAQAIEIIRELIAP
jgi:histidyl-tRNA synthetase